MGDELRRPRKTRDIYDATLALLADCGYDDLAMEAIAARAGVNKTTLYRTWSSKDELLADALTQAPQLEFQVPDTGSLRGDLIATSNHIARMLTESQTRRIVAAMLAALPERPATARATRQFFEERLQREQVIFGRARTRGELAEHAEPTVVMDLLAGALWFHTLIRQQTPEQTDIAALVDSILGGVTAGQ